MAGDALKEFITDFGVPDKIVMDGAAEQMGRKTTFTQQVRKHHIDFNLTKPEQYNQSRVEGVIREIRKKWFRLMMKRSLPKRLWDYGLRWVVEIMQRTASSDGNLHDRTGLEKVTEETPEISEYVDFSFYDWSWYKENASMREMKLGTWLGVSHRTGSLMSFWVHTPSCKVVSRTLVQCVTRLEMGEEATQKRTVAFDETIKLRLRDHAHTLEEDGKVQPLDWSTHPFSDDLDFQEEFNSVTSNQEVNNDDDNFTPDTYDTYVNMELALPQGDSLEPRMARVTKRLKRSNSIPIGTADDNPLLYMRMYEVEYLDGKRTSLSANHIAEILFAQVDDEGNRQVLMKEIIDYCTNGQEVKHQDAFITTRTGTERRRETTKGWEILIEWKDGSTNWVTLKDVKESYPVQLAEYAISNRIAEEPAFAWRVPFVMKKRNCMLAKVKSKYWLRSHKFGIRIPKSVEEAKKADNQNGNTIWWDAICKEMRNMRPAFEVFEGTKDKLPVGYQFMKRHMILDVKFGENFRRKACLVAGGHMTETPATLTYLSVVLRDSVRIALMLAALNDLQVMSCDIQNAYMTADCQEKIWTYAGPKFGSEQGSITFVRKALYGLKSSGAAFRTHLAETLHDISFRPTRADPDVWRPPAKKADGEEYYKYILCYVDDLLAISEDAMKVLQGIQTVFKFKDDKIVCPEVYLGAQLDTMTINGFDGWTMSSQKYVKAAIDNVEEVLGRTNQRLPTKCGTPLKTGYRPELDTSQELKKDGLQRYQELIGMLRWAVELGRVDILLETALMSTHLALPRRGHLEQLYHIFGYLKAHPKRNLLFDLQHPKVDERAFKEYNWYEFYQDAKERLPSDMPPPHGRSVSTHCFVDSDHTGDKVTHRSQTGILIFLNRAPIIWYIKRQNMGETSTFGSEFIAMKTAVEQIESLRYKLRMFGVPLEGPTNFFCDNEEVFKSASQPDSTLKKKHTSICYHRCREAVACRMIRFAKEGTLTNLSDLFTKPLTRFKRENLLDCFTY